jgi:hypothetical protein
MNLRTLARKVVAAISPKTFNRNSQYAHFGMAAAIYLTIGRFSFHWMLYLAPVGIALAAWKEFWYDRHYESDEERGSDLEDFAFYCIGIAYAAVVVAL